MVIDANKISRIAKDHLGRDSLTYRLGLVAFYFSRNILTRLGVSPRRLYDNLELLTRISSQSAESAPSRRGKHIVFFTTRGWSLHVSLEVLLASFLRANGHRVTFVSCNDSLALCAYGSVNSPAMSRRNCQACMKTKNASFIKGFDTVFIPRTEGLEDSITQRVDALNITECSGFEYDGAPYGQLVRPGVVWYLRRSRLTENDAPVFRAALCSAHSVRRGLEELISKTRIDTVVMLNGDFLSEKVASWVLAKHHIRYVTHDYTIGQLLAVAENKSVWDDITFDATSRTAPPDVNRTEKRKAEDILESWHQKGGYQGHLFWSKKDLSADDDPRILLGLKKKPLAVAYSNMTFESSVIGKDRIFRNQFHWLRALVEFFEAHPEFQLVIRIHPAEVRDSHWRPNESLYAFLTKEVREIPPNVTVVGPTDKLSSYALGSIADLVLVYGSTLGLELAERGKCVITAGHVHYAGRGFTADPITQENYFQAVLDGLKGNIRLAEDHRDLIVAYVAWLFGRRLTPVESLTPVEGDQPRVNVSNLADLYSSQQRGFQRVAKFIADGEKWW